MNIIVLSGGLSTERDVSLISGSKIASALRENGHRAVLVDVFFGYQGKYEKPEDIFSMPYDDSIALGIGSSAPDLEKIKESRHQAGNSRIGSNIIDICSASDIVFMALHGEDGENGKLQALFDIMGIRYTGSGYLGSALAMNKGVAKKIFSKSGILAPKGITVSKNMKPYENAGFPCVVKPCSGGSSVGTSVVYSLDEYEKALDFAFEYEDDVIVEQYISGRECDVGVLAGKSLPVIEICPKAGFYDYKNKYQSGLTDEYCPADLPDDITSRLQKEAEKVFDALLLDVYARMDFIVDADGNIYCLEANTLPGMTPLSLIPQEAAVAGISYNELCEFIISESMKKYDK